MVTLAKCAVRWIVVGLIVAVAQSPARAQNANVERSDAEALSRGWAAVAAGRPNDAVSIADQLLRRRSHIHAALMLKIEALSSGAQALPALDLYEQWLAERDGLEDSGLLGPIARALLRQLAAGADLRTSIAALEALALAGDESASQALAAQSKSGNPFATMAMAAAGDSAAVAALQELVATPDRRDKSAVVELLARRGAATPALVATLMTDPVPLNRAAAARLLGTSRLPDATTHLQMLTKDPDPYVRISAQLALARSGDPEAVSAAHRLLSGEVPDLQLLAAESLAEKAPHEVAQALRSLLQNPDGLVRFKAAAMLGRSDPTAVKDVLLNGLNDPNSLVREEAARVLGETFERETAELRRLLRHRDGFVVTRAAAALAVH